MFRFTMLVATMIVLAPIAAFGQAPVPMAEEPFSADLGAHENSTTEFLVIPAVQVSRPGVHWLRVHLKDVHLGERSFVVLRSVLDGEEQALDAETLAAWSHVSAAFHGDAVEVELHVAPGESNIYARVTGLTVPVAEAGRDLPDPRSICGATDDRVASTEPRVGRLPATGCTGWLVSNGAVLTAGHCGVAVGDVLEFNVPASSANGVINAAAVANQYPVTAIATVVNGGVGNDYQLLRLGPNSMNQDRAHVSRGFYRMVQTTPANGTTMRVTGYGLDNSPVGTGGMGAACCDTNGDSVCEFNCNAASQTLQTHTGGYAGLTGGTTHRYSVDTMPANSGSPIIWEAFGITIGIHTHGGCTSSGGSNAGTAFAVAALRNALQAFPGANAVFLDSGISGLPQNGGIFEPYVTMSQASAGVANGGIISIVAGSYPGAITLGTGFKAMTLQAPVGTVTIGN